jgi:hypothetical protein
MIPIERNIRKTDLQIRPSTNIEKVIVSPFQFGMRAGVGDPQHSGTSVTDASEIDQNLTIVPPSLKKNEDYPGDCPLSQKSRSEMNK